MYVGRFIVVGPEIAAYRVSSRSFPHRAIENRGDRLTVVPTAEAEATENPYVSYNCLRVTDHAAVLGNGSHVDPVAEKIGMGYPARDALSLSLLALDFEKDDYDTPRIAGVVGSAGDGEDGAGGAESYVGVVRRDALVVTSVSEPTLVATYERDEPEPFEFGAESASQAARTAYELDFERPVCAAGLAGSGDGFETAIENGQK